MATMTVSGVRKRLKAAIAEAGNASRFAEKHGLNKAQISRAVNGAQPSGPVLEALGLCELKRPPLYQEAGK